MIIVKVKYSKHGISKSIYYKGDQDSCGEFIRSCEKHKIKYIDWIESDSIEKYSDAYDKAEYKSSVDVFDTFLTVLRDIEKEYQRQLALE